MLEHSQSSTIGEDTPCLDQSLGRIGYRAEHQTADHGVEATV